MVRNESLGNLTLKGYGTLKATSSAGPATGFDTFNTDRQLLDPLRRRPGDRRRDSGPVHRRRCPARRDRPTRSGSSRGSGAPPAWAGPRSRTVPARSTPYNANGPPVRPRPDLLDQQLPADPDTAVSSTGPSSRLSPGTTRSPGDPAPADAGQARRSCRWFPPSNPNSAFPSSTINGPANSTLTVSTGAHRQRQPAHVQRPDPELRHEGHWLPVAGQRSGGSGGRAGSPAATGLVVTSNSGDGRNVFLINTTKSPTRSPAVCTSTGRPGWRSTPPD